MTNSEDFSGMSTAEYLQKMAEQNDRLRDTLALFDKLPLGKRRRYQLLVVRCGRCEDVLVEVVQTLDYPVVRHRQAAAHPAAPPGPPVGAGVEGHREHWKIAGDSIRQDEWVFYPLAQPVPKPSGDHRRIVTTCCGCTQVILTEDSLLELIRDGVRRKVVYPAE